MTSFAYRYSGANNETVEVQVTVLDEKTEAYRIRVGEQVFDLSARILHRVAFLKQGGEIRLQYNGKEYHLRDASQTRRPSRSTGGDLRAPMAGKIIRVGVQPGDQVCAGDLLVILEAMKMEQQLTAPYDGVVERILCHEGAQVATGMELVVLRQG